MQPRTKQQEEQVEQYSEYNREQFDRRKLYRTLFMAEVSKRNTLESIHRHNNGHYTDVFGMIGIVKTGRNRA